MVDSFCLYIDDSGTRHPDKKVGRVPKHGHDWFALGGVLLRESEEEKFRAQHQVFCNEWDISEPLHSSEIRARAGKFSFIGRLSKADQEKFYEELYHLMAQFTGIGIACVIDRPGYKARYAKQYPEEKKWLLCKSAFSIVVERAAKFAASHSAKLRVYAEKSDRKTDARLKGYYDELRLDGMPFDTSNSEQYDPMGQGGLRGVLYDFKTKNKTSALTQLADLYLWPMCIGGYDRENRPYARLISDQKLIDCHLAPGQLGTLGVKYYCFDSPEKTKAQTVKFEL